VAGSGVVGYADGLGSSAVFKSVSDVVTANKEVFVADGGNRIRKINSGED
jgi:hypothetical protein